MNKIKGKVYVIGEDIDTDQIIPANRLVYSIEDEEESKNYGRYAMSGLPEGIKKANPFKDEVEVESSFSIIVAGKNFGCGSSREHAPLALEKAGIKAIVAPSYARIFYRNSIDGGFVTPFECYSAIFKEFNSGDEVEIDSINNKITNITKSMEYSIKPLGDVEDIVKSGGIFQYARRFRGTM